MRHLTAVLVVSFLCPLLAATAHGQDTPPNGFQTDFALLVGTLEAHHPGIPARPLQAMTPDAFERERRAVDRRLAAVTTVNGFYYEVMGFLSRLHDAHANVSLSLKGQRLLPLTVQWIGTRAYLTGVHDPALEPLRNAELVSIGGVRVRELERRARQVMAVDAGAPWRSRKPAFGSGFLFTLESWLEHAGLATADGAEVGYLEAGRTRTVRVPFVDITPDLVKPAAPPARNEITRFAQANRATLLPALSTTYVQLSDPSTDLEPGFVERVMKEAIDQQVRFLVLDLRDLSGGDPERVLEVFRYVLDRPLQARLYRTWERSGDANALVFDGVMPLTPVPERDRFRGRIVLFVGPNTFSAGTFPVVLALDNRLATVIGSPCGNASIRYGQVERVKLPASGLTFQYSTRIWERSHPGPAGRPGAIEPNIRVEPDIADHLSGRDPVWDRFVTTFVRPASR